MTWEPGVDAAVVSRCWSCEGGAELPYPHMSNCVCVIEVASEWSVRVVYPVFVCCGGGDGF